ncbi:hypothetical protein QP027_07880 [Corynebacterium breve]|uniref:Uncharacterized protein n=1 Tax=Corynebacterium breve TaxID=3049799 RepID=A0ABY8VBK5_9CORY|nr:hypothetical protein [Corynebacterium breve]WIM67044.1 hypothetical protein QP027_07880 [Corynebacterium breve]
MACAELGSAGLINSADLLNASAVEMAFIGGGRTQPWMPQENQRFVV